MTTLAEWQKARPHVEKPDTSDTCNTKYVHDHPKKLSCQFNSGLYIFIFRAYQYNMYKMRW